MIRLFESSTCFEQLCAHLQEEFVWIQLLVLSLCVSGRPIYRTATNTVIIPEVVFIQLSSWRWAHSCSKHIEDSNKCIIGEIVRQSVTYQNYFFFCGAMTQRESWPPHSWGFLDHTQWRTTVGRTPLDEWSARRRDLYLTTNNAHNRQISLPPVGYKPTISAGDQN